MLDDCYLSTVGRTHFGPQRKYMHIHIYMHISMYAIHIYIERERETFGKSVMGAGVTSPSSLRHCTPLPGRPAGTSNHSGSRFLGRRGIGIQSLGKGSLPRPKGTIRDQ